MNDEELTFSNITEHDLLMIKEVAVQKFLHKNKFDQVMSIVEATFECLNAKGFTITKDENKKVTWSKPNESWYHKQPPKNEYWKK